MKALPLAALLVVVAVPATPGPASAQSPARLHSEIDRLASEVGSDVVRWRLDLHEYSALGNRETRTAALIAAELTRLGYDVRSAA